MRKHMMDMLHLQEIMHNYFGFKANITPGLLPKDFMAMRLNFLLEELQELAASCGFTAGLQDDFEIQYVEDSAVNPNAEGILDALVDLQVVLLGTVHLMGFFNEARLHHAIMEDGSTKVINSTNGFSIFEEAFNRVWQANMKKEVVRSEKESKRGYKVDLKKPEGWTAPDLDDLVQGFNYEI